jgi:ketosteroid isomerase-like protein
MPLDRSPLERVRAYYRDLNSGDPDRVASHFTPDAHHYYTRLQPQSSAREIGELTEQGVKLLDASWHIEHALASGDEVVIEWTMLWRDPRHDNVKRLDRGTEWFRIENGHIAEVRAYHHSDARNRSGDLLGYDHAGRGYTTLERWDEVRERDGAGGRSGIGARPQQSRGNGSS